MKSFIKSFDVFDVSPKFHDMASWLSGIEELKKISLSEGLWWKCCKAKSEVVYNKGGFLKIKYQRQNKKFLNRLLEGIWSHGRATGKVLM